MRIVAGKHKGRRLLTVAGADIRPTSERTREAVFNILTHNRFRDISLQDAMVADLCCGTGAFALEALSRGAAGAVLVDQNAASLKLAAKNAIAMGEGSQCRLLQADVTQLPPAAVACDLVYLDPPYNQGYVLPALRGLLARGWLKPVSMVLVEQQAREVLSPPDGYELLESRQYGNAQITLLAPL